MAYGCTSRKNRYDRFFAFSLLDLGTWLRRTGRWLRFGAGATRFRSLVRCRVELFQAETERLDRAIGADQSGIEAGRRAAGASSRAGAAASMARSGIAELSDRDKQPGG